MSKVISLFSAEPQLWICACGCSTFRLLSDGTAVCAACDKDHEGIGSGWLDRSQDKVTAHKPDETFEDVQGNGSVEFARQRVAQRAKEPSVALIVVARDCGGISAWSAAETDEQIAWAESKLQQAAALIVRKSGCVDE
ncbi:hypothetical protein [Pseudogemmobacter faecipullorum]|uniref:Uncharacterized protein n=1 Tax=Pseudogemmobacter faecipullorum TaxID=2755041 RepID=A0ABS8CQW7_9RHOB|nr:hypothetical protein [Pseudogemmobacter faecipullorum]MCB5411784.1 hypothetical protein [Pseudogemmobacter faecipullorum]